MFDPDDARDALLAFRNRVSLIRAQSRAQLGDGPVVETTWMVPPMPQFVETQRRPDEAVRDALKPPETSGSTSPTYEEITTALSGVPSVYEVEMEPTDWIAV